MIKEMMNLVKGKKSQESHKTVVYDYPVVFAENIPEGQVKILIRPDRKILVRAHTLLTSSHVEKALDQVSAWIGNELTRLDREYAQQAGDDFTLLGNVRVLQIKH